MGNDGGKFVWPPGPAEVNASAISRAEKVGLREHVKARVAGPGPGSRIRTALLDIERTWFGLDTPPLRVRMAEAEWAPDGPLGYCRRCGATVGMHEADDTGCGTCRRRKLPWERMVRLGAFSGLLRQMVLEVKFTRWRRLGDDLGRLLGEALAPVIEAEGLVRERTVLVPVPISLPRRLKRGIDHSAVIARGAGAVLGIPVVCALQRRHGPAQSRQPAGRRRGNVAGVMRAKAGAELAGWNVIVVDDVTTSRATLTAACRAIQESRKGLGDKDEGRMWTAVVGVTPEVGRG